MSLSDMGFSIDDILYATSTFSENSGDNIFVLLIQITWFNVVENGQYERKALSYFNYTKIKKK